MTNTPYDDYANKVISEITRLENELGSMSRSELREYLTVSWLAGLAYSLELMPKEKEVKPIPFEGCR